MNALEQTQSEIPAPRIHFTIPLTTSDAFNGLKTHQRNELNLLLVLLKRIHELIPTAGSLNAASSIVAAAEQFRGRGCSMQTLTRKYNIYLDSGCKWTSLVPAYKGPKPNDPTPKAFLAFLRGKVEDNQRSALAAFEQIVLAWRNGQPIPGYGTWAEYYSSIYPERPLPKHCPAGFTPEGWSARNFYRKISSKGARMLYQRGFAAAKKYFPSVKRDPSGLRPMELIVIDDFELDCLCVFPGDKKNKPQIGRVAGLLAIDVATRSKLHRGIGQRMERIEEQLDGTSKTVRTGISRIDVQTLIFGIFSKHGLPDYPVTILCENAAAAIAPELELALSTLFDGRVRVSRTGLINHRTLANGFLESGGRPWDKGWIESMFNSLWNVMGAMDGYKGNNARITGPADMKSKLKLTRLFIGQGNKALNLPPEIIQQLQLPFPSISAVEETFDWALSILDQRTTHKYIGFDKITGFQLAPGTDPVPMEALALYSPEEQMQIVPVERMESSLERWIRLSATCPRTPIPPAVLALLLLTPKRTVYKNSAVSFVHKDIGYSYVDVAGTALAGYSEGTEFLGYFDQGNPEQLHLATLSGAYVGTLTRLGGRTGMVDIRDQEAIKEAGAIQATVVNRTVAELRERHADKEAELALDKMHNAQVIARYKADTAQLTNAERIAAAATDTAKEQLAARATAKALTHAKGLQDLADM